MPVLPSTEVFVKPHCITTTVLPICKCYPYQPETFSKTPMPDLPLFGHIKAKKLVVAHRGLTSIALLQYLK